MDNLGHVADYSGQPFPLNQSASSPSTTPAHGDLDATQSDTMSAREIGKKLGIQQQTVYRMVAAGTFPVPAIRLGRNILFSRYEYNRVMGISQHPQP